MLTNEETRTGARSSDAPRCRSGSKTDNPCWREAIEPRFLDEEKLTLCAEHALEVSINEDLEHWYGNLQAIDEWIKGPVAEARDDDLQRLAFNMRDEARREYGRLAVRARAARMVADRGTIEPGGASLSLEQEEEIARRMLREEALNAAVSILEDAHEDDLSLRDRWATIDALGLASVDAAEEVERYKEELGISE